MLLEVVQTGPLLLRLLAVGCKAFVVLAVACILIVNRLLMSVQIVDCGETLDRPRTVPIVAFVRSVMTRLVFSVVLSNWYHDGVENLT